MLRRSHDVYWLGPLLRRAGATSLAFAIGLGSFGCGPEPSSPTSDDSESDAADCEPATASGQTTLEVRFDIPDELVTGCGGDVQALEVYLTLPGADTCALDVRADTNQVVGCCAGVATDQNAYATVLYRDAGSRRPVAEQGKTVALPADTPSLQPVSFSATPLSTPYQDNYSRWCAGEL